MEQNRKFLQSLLKENWRSILILLTLSFFAGILSLTVPWFMKFFTDDVILGDRWGILGIVVVVFLIIILLRGVVDMIYERILAWVSNEKIACTLRKKVETILIRMDSKYLHKEAFEMQEKDVESILIGDVESLKNILMQTIKFFAELLKLLLYISILFMYSVPVGLVVALRIPVYFVCAKLFSKPLSNSNEENRALQSKLIQQIKRIYESLLSIKTLRLERDVTRETDSMVTDFCRNKSDIAVLNAGYQEINTAINTCVNIAVLVICGGEILKGNLTIGTMVLISNIQSRTVMPLFFFNNYYLQYKSCFPGITRLVNFLNTDIEEELLPQAPEEDFRSIELKNLGITYDNESFAIRHVNFTIHSGDKIILTGDNMSGKSTLLNAMAGLIRPDEGEILLNGKKADYATLRRNVVLFLQNQNAYSYFGNTGSGGEIQLKNLSILKDVKKSVILLDEADASINGERADEIYGYLDSRLTVLIVTHRDTDAVLAKYPNAKVISMQELSQKHQSEPEEKHWGNMSPEKKILGNQI